MKRKLVGFILLFFILGPIFSRAQQPPPPPQQKTGLLDFTVRPVGTQYLYSGRFILRETNEPFVDGYVYLINPQTRAQLSETRTDDTGYFEMLADAPDLTLMISTSPVRSREGEATEIPWLASFTKKIPTWFPKEQYGYKNLILDPQAEIFITKKDAVLKLKRSLSFSLESGISESSFDALEAVALLYQHFQENPMFHSGALGFIKIPYSAGKQDGYFFHPVVQVVMQDRPTRTFSFYLDASPLSFSHTHAKVILEHQVRDNFPVVANILDDKNKQVLLSPTVPINVLDNLYSFAGISRLKDKNEVLVDFTIHQWKENPEKIFDVESSHILQLYIPQDKFSAFRTHIRRYKPENFLSHLPDFVKKMEAGSVDKAMKAAFKENLPVFYALIQKSTLAEESPIWQRENLLEKIEERVLEETEWGRKTATYIASRQTTWVLDLASPEPARYYFGEDTIHYNPSLYSSVASWEEELLLGSPLRSILSLHEELHRAQMKFSKWGKIIGLYRKHGKIQETIMPDGKIQTTFTLQLVSPEVFLEDAALVLPESTDNLSSAIETLDNIMKHFAENQEERGVLREIHAYWASNSITTEDLYKHLYVDIAAYDYLKRVPRETFNQLCQMIDDLYAVFDLNHDKVGAFVGGCDSISEFITKAVDLKSQIDPYVLEQRLSRWQQLKADWVLATKRIAQEELKTE